MIFMMFANALRTVPRSLALCALLTIAPGIALADTPANPGPPSPAAAATDTTTSDASTAPAVANVDGFRSAKFGMSMDDVKAAIIKDFGVKPTAIATGENTAERTQVLGVSVPDLLQDGGTAQVSYVFGYKSKTLIQVGISWSQATDPAMTPAKLYADGDTLRAHFVTEGYKPDTVKTGLVLPNGLLLFRGEDAAGHATILILQGSFKADAASKQQVLTPTSLALLYSANPQNPDVFKISPGQF